MSLSWITFTDKIIMRNFDECKCEMCNKEYDGKNKLHWIKTQSDFPFTFCEECYKIIIEEIENIIENKRT